MIVPDKIEEYGRRVCEALEILGASGTLNISFLPDLGQYALICNLETLAIVVTTLVIKAEEFKAEELRLSEEGH